MNYENKLVAAFCMLPTTIFVVLLLSTSAMWLFVVGFILLLLVSNLIYQFAVLYSVGMYFKQWQRYWITFFFQIFLLFIFLFL